MPKTRPLIALAAGLLVGAASGAPNESSAEPTTSHLERRDRALTRQLLTAPKEGPAERREIALERQRIRDQIARLKRGDTSVAAEIRESNKRRVLSSDSPRADLASHARAKQDALERQIATGPKEGPVRRTSIRNEIDQLDAIIANLEAGRNVDDASMAALVGIMAKRAPLTVAEELQDSRVQLATLTRRLRGGPKIGPAERSRIRKEMERLEAEIARLEGGRR